MPRHGFPDDSPDSLWWDVIPCRDNRHDTANAKRVLYYCGDRLVVVPPEESDKRGTQAEVYAITPTGMLSWTEAGSLITEAATRYSQDCDRLLGGGDHSLCKGHAARMQNAASHAAIWKVMDTAVSELLRAGRLPPWVVVERRDHIDADLTCIGTPGGVVDLLGGRILPPQEARERLVVTSTPVEYEPDARHPLVDRILPPVGPGLWGNEMAWYRALILGYGLVHEPQREFMWEICSEGSGKSTFVNTLREALGHDYMQTIRPEILASRPAPELHLAQWGDPAPGQAHPLSLCAGVRR